MDVSGIADAEMRSGVVELLSNLPTRRTKQVRHTLCLCLCLLRLAFLQLYCWSGLEQQCSGSSS